MLVLGTKDFCRVISPDLFISSYRGDEWECLQLFLLFYLLMLFLLLYTIIKLHGAGFLVTKNMKRCQGNSSGNDKYIGPLTEMA